MGRLIMNELGELYRSDEFEPPKLMKLHYDNEPVQISEKPGRDERAEWRQTIQPRKRRGTVAHTGYCHFCGAEYKKRRSDQRFCSNRCRHDYFENRTHVTRKTKREKVAK